MKYLKIRIDSGNSDSLFDIFYDSPSGVGQALLFDTGLPAVDIPYDTLIIGEGITVSVPDNATSIVLDSSPSAFCTGTFGINTPMYTIPIGCMSYTVSASMGSSNYYYTDCDCIPITATIDATYGYTEQTFCALQDTVSAGLLTVVDNGACTTPPTDVYIGACGPDQYDGLGVYPLTLYGDTSISPVGGNPIPIDSFLIVDISLYNGSTLIETISRNIPYPGPGGVGFTCYTVYGYGGSPSQVVDGIVIDSVTPPSGANQNYITGDGATSLSCPSCSEPLGDVTVNNISPNYVIINVSGIPGFTLSETLSDGETQTGTHSEFNGIISVGLNSSGVGVNAILYLIINGVEVDNVEITGTGVYTLDAGIVESLDTIIITLE